MRQMRNVETGHVLNITEHVIVRNFWEYYITDDVWDGDESGDIVRAFVMGYANELGDISLKEIAPYALSRTKNLEEVFPASGYEWVDNN